MTMPLPIQGVGQIGSLESLAPAAPRPIEADKGAGFGDTLTRALSDARDADQAASAAAEKFAAGDPSIGIHEVMIAAEKASISVRYAVTLKNKVLEAYRELMNTPL
ncbi:MAG TPA: flagellar hook-basal body complex protein FliE [Haliangiales bacterium]|nr:flagellar hook-basal body complex protein FliE [Haliangiales bacterium]